MPPRKTATARPRRKHGPDDRGMQALERLAKLAAALLDCPTAVLLFNQDGVSRVVCGHGVEAGYLSYRWDYAGAPYGPNDRYIVADATERAEVQSASVFVGGRRVGFFLRTPVKVESTHTLTLLVLGHAARGEVLPAEIKILDDIVAMILDEFRDIEPLLVDDTANVSVPVPLDALKSRVEAMAQAAALLDEDRRVVAVNEAMAALLQRAPADLIGRTKSEIVPQFSELLLAYFQRALEDKISTPAIEVTRDAGEGEPRTYSVVASPLSPLDTPAYFLLITARDITGRIAMEEQLDAAIEAVPRPAKPRPEPSADFLIDTLVERTTIRTRNGMSYMTVRAWRSPVRAFQISALKALKRKVPDTFADRIADEIIEGASGLVGTDLFKAVVPIPCGHSPAEDCLSLAIARAIGRRLGRPVILALESQRLKGSSHPRQNMTRPPMTLLQPVEGPVLLVDDVATSGAHLQEGVELLRPGSGSVMSIAWIGGDAKGS